MPRGWKRTWVKFWVDECLDGSIREELESDERGVWYDLIIYSAKCRVAGIISANETQPISHKRLAGILNISDELLERTLEKCQGSDRIKIDKNGLIHIVNWVKYQSEYQRQKQYQVDKERKLTPPIPETITEITIETIPDWQGYCEELRQEYPDVDFDEELKKFQLYWAEGRRKLKRPKLALKNWMINARRFKAQALGNKEKDGQLSKHAQEIKEALRGKS